MKIDWEKVRFWTVMISIMVIIGGLFVLINGIYYKYDIEIINGKYELVK